MPQRGVPDGWDSLAKAPSLVEVTVEPGPGGGRPRSPVGRGWGLAALGTLVAGVVLAGAVIAAGGLSGTRHAAEPARGPVPAWAPVRSPPGVYLSTARPTPVMRGVDQLVTGAEAYRFPLGCMGITLTPRGLAAALRSRTGPCWRYGLFVTAILRRVGGVWRLALEATSGTCPRVPLPAPVRAQVAVCRR